MFMLFYFQRDFCSNMHYSGLANNGHSRMTEADFICNPQSTPFISGLRTSGHRHRHRGNNNKKKLHNHDLHRSQCLLLMVLYALLWVIHLAVNNIQFEPLKPHWENNKSRIRTAWTVHSFFPILFFLFSMYSNFELPPKFEYGLYVSDHLWIDFWALDWKHCCSSRMTNYYIDCPFKDLFVENL